MRKIMSSISIGIVRIQPTVGRVVAIENAGKQIVRWGLIVVLAWIGAMKFTAYEAMGIQPLVAHSPLVGWMYDFLSIRSFSAILGCIEIGTAALISLQYLSPKASALGAVLAIGLFANDPVHGVHNPRMGTHSGLPCPIGTARTVPAQGHRAAGSLSLVARGIAQVPGRLMTENQLEGGV
jgi:uncharacterized membrane protein YkgB